MSKVFALQLQQAIEKKELSKSKLATDFIAKFGVATKNAKITKVSDAVKETAQAILKKGVKVSEGFRTYLQSLAGVEPIKPAEVKPTTKKASGEY